jgi:hypothetical protein
MEEQTERKMNECKEVKGVSPESDTKPRETLKIGKVPILSCEDAGHAASAIQTSASRHPGVADSIELHNGRRTARQATKARALGESAAMEVPEYRAQHKRRVRKGSVAVMGTGKPQGHSDEASNDRRAKVTHAMVNREREVLTLCKE